MFDFPATLVEHHRELLSGDRISSLTPPKFSNSEDPGRGSGLNVQNERPQEAWAGILRHFPKASMAASTAGSDPLIADRGKVRLVMPGKRVQFDDDTWQAINAVLSRSSMMFQGRAPACT